MISTVICSQSVSTVASVRMRLPVHRLLFVLLFLLACETNPVAIPDPTPDTRLVLTIQALEHSITPLPRLTATTVPTPMPRLTATTVPTPMPTTSGRYRIAPERMERVKADVNTIMREGFPNSDVSCQFKEYPNDDVIITAYCEATGTEMAAAHLTSWYDEPATALILSAEQVGEDSVRVTSCIQIGNDVPECNQEIMDEEEARFIMSAPYLIWQEMGQNDQ